VVSIIGESTFSQREGKEIRFTRSKNEATSRSKKGKRRKVQQRKSCPLNETRTTVYGRRLDQLKAPFSRKHRGKEEGGSGVVAKKLPSWH